MQIHVHRMNELETDRHIKHQVDHIILQELVDSLTNTDKQMSYDWALMIKKT